jgi:hypothetical protein
VTRILQQETRTIPIVFAFVGDPVGSGFAASLARPGKNITGFANFENSIGGNGLSYSKRLRLAPNESASSSIPTLLPTWVFSTRPKQLLRHSE